MDEKGCDNKCFICLDEDDLQKAKFCRGYTYFHNKCLQEYCTNYTNNENKPICPICKSDISDKFQIITSIDTVTNINWNKFMFYLGIILWGVILVSGIVLVCLLPEPNYIGYTELFVISNMLGPIIGIVVSKLLLAIREGLWDHLTIQHLNNSPLIIKLAVYLYIATPTIINHTVLLITATISYINSELISTDLVMLISCIMGVAPVGMFLVSVYVIPGAVLLFYGIHYTIYNCCTMSICTETTKVVTNEYTVRDEIVSNI